jgi:Cytochrome P460
VSVIPTVNISQGQTRIRFEAPPSQPRPAPSEKSREEKGHTYGVVYANEFARAALAGDLKFPAGSIIVREKLLKPDNATPQLLAVMVKRAPGFSPKGGDWEFLTVDGALTKVTGRQKTGSCLDCHASQRERDFVFPVPAAK